MRRRDYVLDPSENDENETSSPGAALLKLLVASAVDIKEMRILMYRHMCLPVGELKKKRIYYSNRFASLAIRGLSYRRRLRP